MHNFSIEISFIHSFLQETIDITPTKTLTFIHSK